MNETCLVIIVVVSRQHVLKITYEHIKLLIIPVTTETVLMFSESGAIWLQELQVNYIRWWIYFNSVWQTIPKWCMPFPNEPNLTLYAMFCIGKLYRSHVGGKLFDIFLNWCGSPVCCNVFDIQCNYIFTDWVFAQSVCDEQLSDERYETLISKE